jgi:hypothetical protein
MGKHKAHNTFILEHTSVHPQAQETALPKPKYLPPHPASHNQIECDHYSNDLYHSIGQPQ